VLDRAEREQLGATARAPRWAAAYKFLPEQQETTLNAITIQVGRTGVLTPVAELTPVLISGSTVARATLHNQEEITRKGIHIGDTVLVEKAGEIIPAIVKVIRHLPGSVPFLLSDHVGGKCPSCGGPISQEEGFVAWRCTNFQCPAQAVTRITHFASRKALDLDGLGEAVAEALVRHGHCATPLDLFDLTESILANLNLANLNLGSTEESCNCGELEPSLSSFETDTAQDSRRFGEKNAAKLLEALEAAKSKPLHRWLFALGISQIGEEAAKEIAKFHKSFEEIRDSSILRDLLTLDEIYASAQQANSKGDGDKIEKYYIEYTHLSRKLEKMGVIKLKDQEIPDINQNEVRELRQAIEILADPTFMGDLDRLENLFKATMKAKELHKAAKKELQLKSGKETKIKRIPDQDEKDLYLLVEKLENALINSAIDPKRTRIRSRILKEFRDYNTELGLLICRNSLDYFNSDVGAKLLYDLGKLGVKLATANQRANTNLSLAGKTFVITGTLSIERDAMEALIESYGGKVSASVSAKTDFLLCGEGGGSKKSKAEKLPGVKIIDEAEFRKLIDSR